jgi:hypothetical protein
MSHRKKLGKLGKKLKQLLPAVTVTLTTIPFAAWSPSASAFFPPVWGTTPPSVVPPTQPPIVVQPPLLPPTQPPVIVVPPTQPPVIVVPPTQPPNGVPEPATMVSALIGLAAAAGYGLKRRGAKKDEGAAGEPGA